MDRSIVYFDKNEIKSTQLLGYTRESEAAVYRIFYNDNRAEDLVDKFNALNK